MSKLTEILAKHGVYDGKTSLYFEEDVKAFKKSILAWVNEVIGEDLPLVQPLDNEMDPIQYEGNRMFRKGANWSKAEQRKRAGL